jgi:hypothetical protein
LRRSERADIQAFQNGGTTMLPANPAE